MQVSELVRYFGAWLLIAFSPGALAAPAPIAWNAVRQISGKELLSALSDMPVACATKGVDFRSGRANVFSYIQGDVGYKGYWMTSRTQMLGGTLFRLNVAGNGSRIVAVHFRDKPKADLAIQSLRKLWSTNGIAFSIKKSDIWSEEEIEKYSETMFVAPEELDFRSVVSINEFEYATVGKGSKGYYVVIRCGVTFGP